MRFRRYQEEGSSSPPSGFSRDTPDYAPPAAASRRSPPSRLYAWGRRDTPDATSRFEGEHDYPFPSLPSEPSRRVTQSAPALHQPTPRHDSAVEKYRYQRQASSHGGCDYLSITTFTPPATHSTPEKVRTPGEKVERTSSATQSRGGAVLCGSSFARHPVRPAPKTNMLSLDVMRPPKYGGRSKREQLGSIGESWGDIPGDVRIGLFQPPPNLLDRVSSTSPSPTMAADWEYATEDGWNDSSSPTVGTHPTYYASDE